MPRMPIASPARIAAPGPHMHEHGRADELGGDDRRVADDQRRGCRRCRRRPSGRRGRPRRRSASATTVLGVGGSGGGIEAVHGADCTAAPAAVAVRPVVARTRTERLIVTRVAPDGAARRPDELIVEEPMTIQLDGTVVVHHDAHAGPRLRAGRRVLLHRGPARRRAGQRRALLRQRPGRRRASSTSSPSRPAAARRRRRRGSARPRRAAGGAAATRSTTLIERLAPLPPHRPDRRRRAGRGPDRGARRPGPVRRDRRRARRRRVRPATATCC